MTRFARAKGSKASNERLPEPATSWHEMKQQLLDKNMEDEERKKREKVLQQRNANYQAFLQEKEEEESNTIAWADFQDQTLKVSKKRKVSKGEITPMKKIKKSKELYSNTQKNSDFDLGDSDPEFNDLKSKIEIVLSKQNGGESDSDAPPEEMGVKEKPPEIVVKKSKKTKKKLKINISNNKETDNVEEANSEKKKSKVNKDNLTDKEKKKIAKKHERFKKQLEKKKLKKQGKKIGSQVDDQDKNQPETADVLDVSKKSSAVPNLKKIYKDNLSEKDLAKIEKKKQKRARQVEKRKKFKEARTLQNNSDKTGTNTEKDTNNISKNNNFKKVENSFIKDPSKRNLNQKQSQKKEKFRDKNKHDRKKPISQTMFINGKTVEIDYVDGFPIKKDDAERLKQLRKEMITKGLPRSEINVALKLERRRAEKALARDKKNVCFNCRLSGHILAECPKLNEGQVAQTTGTGICFKCGSTEHTHFECKVVRGLDYKFANCFICNEQGHIARQCPDNQRGLYPKGGSCRVCGDVTHLKKDCPKYQAQQDQLNKNFSIETWDSKNPDVLDTTNSYNKKVTDKPNKIIKF